MTEPMNTPDFETVPTITGKWFKFESAPQVDLLIDLPSNIIIGISTSTASIECFVPDLDETYHYAGDLHFNHRENSYMIDFHGRSISSLSFNNEKIQIPTNNGSLRDIRIGLDINKSIDWFKSVKF